MAKMGWAKFWFRDYESDIDLRMCSFAAQGLWMRMLCRMHEGEPYGYLTMHGKPVADHELHRLLNGDPQEIKALLDELENKQVFCRDKNGAIFCRRMVRDGKRSAIYAANGAHGGNPTLKKKKEEGAEEDEKSKLDNQTGYADDKAEIQNQDKPSRSSRSSRKKDSSLRSESPSNDPFEQWWRAYPKRVGKAEARKHFAAALKETTLEVLLEAIPRYVATVREPRFLLDPERWLKRKRWLDDGPLLAGTPVVQGAREPLSREMAAKAQALARLGGLDVGKKTHDDVTGPMINEAGETIHEHA